MSNQAGLPKAPRENVGTSDWAATGLPVLHAPLLTLREVRPSDAPSLARWLKRSETWQFTEALPQNALGFVAFISQILQERRAGRAACFAIVPLGLNQGFAGTLIRGTLRGMVQDLKGIDLRRQIRIEVELEDASDRGFAGMWRGKEQ